MRKIIKTEISYFHVKRKTTYHRFIRECVALSFSYLKGKKKIPAGSLAARESVSLLICDDDKMKQLNKRYRNIEKPTNELSFSYLDDPHSTVIGEIVINWDELLRDSDNSFSDRKLSLLNFITHAVLHLVGFNHNSAEDENLMEDQKIKMCEYIKKRTVEL